MRTPPKDVYDTLKGKIQNDEVPDLLMSALLKQDKFIGNHIKELDEHTRTKAIIFSTFVRQYNTVLALAKKTPCVIDDNVLFLDMTSMFTLVRSCHERYLAFWHLNTPLGCWNVTSEQELQFRWLCFKHGGLVDEVRSFDLTARLRDLSKMSATMEMFKSERRKLFREISAHGIFAALDERTRKDIKLYGNWRIGPNGSMSWSELVQVSPLHNSMGQYEYFQMNQHTHTCYRGLSMTNKFHDNVNNGLAYLYALASMFAYDLDSMLPGSDAALDIRELTLIHELRQIATQWMEIPALDENGKPIG